MSHLERRANLWYAVLVIPKDARESLGKLKFIQSLKTPSKREAERRAAPLIAKWRALIDQARGRSDAVLHEALRWKEAMTAADDKPRGDGEDYTERDHFADALSDHAEHIERTKGEHAAHSFYNIATGKHTPAKLYLGEWQAQLELAEKTKEQMCRDVRLMVERFPVLEDTAKREVRKWLLEELNATPSSANRIAGNCRNFWRYLKAIHAVPDDRDGPFDKLDLRRANRRAEGTGKWLPFAAKDVVKLWTKAREKGDSTLADLIAIGAYTGARIEELCSAKLEDIRDNALHVTDAKTGAGIRAVPIHSALRPLMRRLRTASKDDYMLSGLTFNKYGDRSNAIGKRFGRLKDAAGFGDRYLFHSIRKTLVTLLENAGISENVAADIVGHEKPRITYGLYSGGASMQVKREALERVRYPFVGLE